MSDVRVFVSFDLDHDRDLFELLLEQSRAPSSGFSVSGSSQRPTLTGAGREEARGPIRDADQVIVLCGEHTGLSACVAEELRIAQEERIPYFLLWGRRDIMCTKPIGARRFDGMCSWTRQILQDRITLTLRRAAADEAAWTAPGLARRR